MTPVTNTEFSPISRNQGITEHNGITFLEETVFRRAVLGGDSLIRVV